MSVPPKIYPVVELVGNVLRKLDYGYGTIDGKLCGRLPQREGAHHIIPNIHLGTTTIDRIVGGGVRYIVVLWADGCIDHYGYTGA